MVFEQRLFKLEAVPSLMPSAPIHLTENKGGALPGCRFCQAPHLALLCDGLVALLIFSWVSLLCQQQPRTGSSRLVITGWP